MNTVSISLQLSARLYINSTVTISGLRGSVTPSGLLTVEADEVSFQLVLTLAADTESYKIYTIHINLENPPSGQPSPFHFLLYASSRGGEGQEQELLPVEFCQTRGIHSQTCASHLTISLYQDMKQS